MTENTTITPADVAVISAKDLEPVPGISSAFGMAFVSRDVDVAMGAAAEKAMEDGVNDPDAIKDRMLAARDELKRQRRETYAIQCAMEAAERGGANIKDPAVIAEAHKVGVAKAAREWAQDRAALAEQAACAREGVTDPEVIEARKNVARAAAEMVPPS